MDKLGFSLSSRHQMASSSNSQSQPTNSEQWTPKRMKPEHKWLMPPKDMVDGWSSGRLQEGSILGTCGICQEVIALKIVKSSSENQGRPYGSCDGRGHSNFCWVDGKGQDGKVQEKDPGTPTGAKVCLAFFNRYFIFLFSQLQKRKSVPHCLFRGMLFIHMLCVCLHFFVIENGKLVLRTLPACKMQVLNSSTIKYVIIASFSILYFIHIFRLRIPPARAAPEGCQVLSDNLGHFLEVCFFPSFVVLFIFLFTGH